MPSPKKNTAYVFYIALVDSANRPQFKANPTIAAGDFKATLDGSVMTNLTTLPSVEPAGSKIVKVSLSAAEMNGDKIGVIASDVVGAEWDDAFIYIEPDVRNIDDLAFPTVSGRSLDIATTGEAGLDFDNIKDATGAHTLTNITIPIVTATGVVSGNVGGNVVGTVASVVGGVGGNVAGSVASVVAAVDITAGAQNAVADATLARNIQGGGSGGARTVRDAIRSLRNRQRIAAGVLTVFEEDDTTPAWTAAVTDAPVDPIVEIDPT